MTYEQLLPMYQQITGKQGGDAAFNEWVQGIVNQSGSQQGVEGIPENFFTTGLGQQYIKSTTTVTPPNTVGPNGNFGQLIVPTPDAPSFTQAPQPNVTGGNYNQVQNATQGGQFGTVGLNTNTQSSTSGQDSTGTVKTTGTQDTSSTTNQDTTTSGTQDSTSQTSGTTTTAHDDTTTTGAVDTLGFGKLLQDQATGVVATDADRQGWLKDVMQTGGTGFSSQIDQAIRSSLTGPQMSGAGDSARARAAGYAAAETGRTNLNQRLAASEQLAGPTGLSTLSTAANPYIGSTSVNKGTSTSFQDLLTKGTTNTTGTQSTAGSTDTTSSTDQLQNTNNSTTGFQDLVSSGSEVQAGTTQGQSSQAGAGQIPQGQPVKTGGCVLCTAAVELNLPHANNLRILRRVIEHKLTKDWPRFRNAARGYFHVFAPFAAWLLSYPRIARTLWPIARAVVYEELRISGRRLPWKAGAWAAHWIGHSFCAAVGRFLRVPGYVTEPRIVAIAKRNNISFEVQS